jgi:hypothetical protein
MLDDPGERSVAFNKSNRLMKDLADFLRCGKGSLSRQRDRLCGCIANPPEAFVAAKDFKNVEDRRRNRSPGERRAKRLRDVAEL